MESNPFQRPTSARFDSAVAAPVRPNPSYQGRGLTSDQRGALRAWVEATQLDPDQRSVIALPLSGTHKVLANAGSGKTHTLIARAIHILAETDAAPQNLALLTFTNRAAKEMKERFRKILTEVTGSEKGPMPFIGTIHGFAYQVVTQAEGLGQTILTESGGRSLLRRLIRTEFYPDDKEKGEHGFVRNLHAIFAELAANNELHLFVYPMWVGDKLEVWSHRDPRWTPELRAAHRYPDQTARTLGMVLTGTPVEEIRPEALDWTDAQRADIRGHYTARTTLSEPEFTALLKAFMAAKYANRTFEFSDLLYYPLAYLTQHPHALQAAWKRFRYIFQDEAQDQDTLQYALIRLVAGKNPNVLFCADTKQTLYFWRNARPDITDYLDRVNTPPLHLPAGVVSEPQAVSTRYLRTNYRSVRQLVELANVFAENFTTRSATPSIPFKPGGTKPIAVQHFEDSNKEFKHIAQTIAQAVGTGKRRYMDYAVLAYSNKALLDIEAAFVAEQVPYHLKHDNRSTTKQSTFRVMAGYYALAINPRDVTALCEIVESVKGMGEKFSLRLQRSLNRIFQADTRLSFDTLDWGQVPDFKPDSTQGRLVQAFLTKMVRPFIQRVRSERHAIPELNLELRQACDDHGVHDGDEHPLLGNRVFGWKFSAEALRRVTRTLDQIYHTLMEDAEFIEMPEMHKIAHIQAILSLGSDENSQEDLDEDYTGPSDKKDRVTLATGHAYKGKQARVVYLANLQSSAPPREDPEEEARCWWYVGITRAEEELVLTASHSVPDFKGRMRQTRENPLLLDYMAAIRAYRERARSISKPAETVPA